jgi:hypothetical protein
MIEHPLADSTREPIHVQIARACNRDPRPILPPDTPNDVADRLTMLVIGGASALQVPAACGDVEYRDGYARRKLATFDFRELEHLIDDARARLLELSRGIGPLALGQRRLAWLLSPAAADETASAPLDDDAGDDGIDGIRKAMAAGLRGNPGTAPSSRRPASHTPDDDEE